MCRPSGITTGVSLCQELLERESVKVKVTLYVLLCYRGAFCPSCTRRSASIRLSSNGAVPEYPAQHAQALGPIVYRVALPQRGTGRAAIGSPVACASQQRGSGAAIARDKGRSGCACGALLRGDIGATWSSGGYMAR